MQFANTLRTVYKASDFVNWYSQGALDLAPFFQRRPVWQPGAKSYLIDTIVRGFPIPSLIFREKPTSLSSLIATREVVDGQQRLRTLIAFVAPTALKDFDPQRDDFTINKAHNPELAGMKFADLTKEHRQRILDYQFTAHIFSADTDDRDVLEVFARMNATGLKLNAQELRNAEYFGFFKTQAFELATEQLARWRKFRVFTDGQIGRMTEVEFTSELLILVHAGISEGSSATIDRYYKQFDASYPHREIAATRFRKTMDVIAERFDFREMERMQNRTLFYCLFAAVYDVLYGLGSTLAKAKPRSLTIAKASNIASRGRSLTAQSAPVAIQSLTERRMAHARERRAVTNYLLGN